VSFPFLTDHSSLLSFVKRVTNVTGETLFTGYYSFKRFGYIHSHFEENDLFSNRDAEIVPKTACFISDKLDVYIDTSDGVNDDLKIQEYCGRILACAKLSRGKRFLFFKSAYSSRWSNGIEEIARQNNGRVIPFFKWSFNDDYYRHTQKNLSDLRSQARKNSLDTDLGLFADFSKEYMYPMRSANDSRVSFDDINKFHLEDIFGRERTIEKKYLKIKSREELLNKISDTGLTLLHGVLPYKQYIQKSLSCRAILNPPGIGEYTSRLFDQTSIGNLIILRKNTYDQGHSWKNFIPQVDFTQSSWEENINQVLDDREEWREKGRYYFENYWSSISIFEYFIKNIQKELSIV